MDNKPKLTWIRAEDVDWSLLAGTPQPPPPLPQTITNIPKTIQQLPPLILTTPQHVKKALSSMDPITVGEHLCKSILDTIQTENLLVVSRETVNTCEVLVSASPQAVFDTLVVPLVRHDGQASCELAQHLLSELNNQLRVDDDAMKALILAQSRRFSEHQLFLWQRGILGKWPMTSDALVDVMFAVESVSSSSPRLPGFLFALIKSLDGALLTSYQDMLSDVLDKSGKANSKNKMMVTQALTELKKKRKQTR